MLLEESGSELAHITKIVIYIVDPRYREQVYLVVGKWLIRDLKLLIVDEPTVGVDIGAKEEMYQTIERLANEGVAVLVASSDLPELTRLSDRIIVLRKGRIIKEFTEGVVTEEEVLRAASGIVEGDAK